MKPKRSFWHNQRGAAAVELVLMLPFITLLLFGAVELGYYFYCEHQVVKGVRDGARFGSRQSFVDVNCASNTPYLSSAVETLVKEMTRTGRVSGGTARSPGWTNAEISVTVTCPAIAIQTGIYKGADNSPQINVVASVPYNSLMGGLGIVDSTYHLNASQQAAVMGI